MTRDIVYLTGTPASGKSTLGKLLSEKYKNILYIQYGAELTNFLRMRERNIKNHEELREKSSKIVTKDDIEELDSIIASKIYKSRLSKTVILDSHAVTKEEYGYRIVPFNVDKLKTIGFNRIFVLYAPDKIIIDRIISNRQGRASVDSFEASMHRELQCSLAVMYGSLLGIPIYYFDSSKSTDVLADLIANKLGLIETN